MNLRRLESRALWSLGIGMAIVGMVGFVWLLDAALDAYTCAAYASLGKACPI